MRQPMDGALPKEVLSFQLFRSDFKFSASSVVRLFLNSLITFFRFSLENEDLRPKTQTKTPKKRRPIKQRPLENEDLENEDP